MTADPVPLTGGQTLRAGAALLANSASNSILGVLYWVLAARTTSPEDLGRGSTLVSTLVVVSALAQLNYSRSLSYLLPRAGSRALSVLARAYARAVVSSGLLAATVVLLLAVVRPREVPALGLAGGAVFVVGTMLWSVFALQDSALTALRRTAVIPVENTLFGLAKIVGLLALPMLALSRTWVIPLTWIVPLPLLVLGVNYLIFARSRVEDVVGTDAAGPTPDRLVDAVGSYSMMVSPLFLQYLVLSELGATSAALLFIPATLAASADALSSNVGNAITAEVTRSGGRFPPQLRRLVAFLLGGATAGALLVAVVGKPLLDLFGERYGQSSLTLLICFGFAAAARAGALCSAAVQRARGQARRAMLLQLTMALGPLLAAVLVALGLVDLTGVGVAWLATSLGAAALGAVYSRRASPSAHLDHLARR